MTRVLLWLAITYCAFKFVSVLHATGPGFSRTEIGWGDRARAGEPGLFLAALLISAPLALLMNSYSRRTYTSSYRNSVTCYGRITALRDLPEIRKSADSFTLYESVQGYKALAFGAGKDLEMKQDTVSRALAKKVRFFSEKYQALQRQEMQQRMEDEVGMALRCLHPPAEAPNA